MIRARCLRTAMMVCLALIGACGAHESAGRAAATADALEAFVSPRVAAGASHYCDEGVIEVLDGPPVNRSRAVAVKRCWARSSDTMDYAYRDSTGRLLVVGREIEQRYPVESWQDTTAPAELETLRAAVRNGLVARYGKSGRCPPRPARGEAPEQWITDDYYVLLNTWRVLGSGGVVMERWAGEPACHVEGGPRAR